MTKLSLKILIFTVYYKALTKNWYVTPSLSKHSPNKACGGWVKGLEQSVFHNLRIILTPPHGPFHCGDVAPVGGFGRSGASSDSDDSKAPSLGWSEVVSIPVLLSSPFFDQSLTTFGSPTPSSADFWPIYGFATCLTRFSSDSRFSSLHLDSEAKEIITKILKLENGLFSFW